MLPFKTYSEIPEKISTFVENITGMKITNLTIQQINQTIHELEEYYESVGQNFNDFVV